jgi:hypothetical protein
LLKVLARRCLDRPQKKLVAAWSLRVAGIPGLSWRFDAPFIDVACDIEST